MRLRNSVSSASGTFTWNGRIALLSEVCSLPRSVSTAWVMVCSFQRNAGNLEFEEISISALHYAGKKRLAHHEIDCFFATTQAELAANTFGEFESQRDWDI